MSHRAFVTAHAPATVSNLGPGFDVLGCAVEGAEDAVTASFTNRAGVFIAESGHPELPRDADRHASGIAAREVLRRCGAAGVGVELRVSKGIPLAGGQGGSAASAVAAAVAVDALLEAGLSRDELLLASLAAEERVAGRHADNLAAALFGGLVLVRSMDPPDIVPIPVPPDLRVVVVHPDQRMNTREGRAAVPGTFGRDTLIFQSAQIAALVAALMSSDYGLISRALQDRVAEPYRARLLPGFSEAKSAAIQAGALGASISGSGPTSFALVQGDAVGQRVLSAMFAAYRLKGLECDGRVSGVGVGASVG
jgi:homoserine kinase